MKHTMAGKITFLLAVFGFLTGLLLFALTGYSFFSSEPPPLASAFSASRPLTALLSAFSFEVLFIGAMALLSLLIGGRTAGIVLFLRGILLSFSAAYLYGSHPAPFLYLSYVLPSASIYIAEAALCELCSAPREPKRLTAIARCAPSFFYYTGVILCLITVMHLLLALAG